MNPHRRKKPASDESTSDEEEMIVYDVEDEIESNPDYVKENATTEKIDILSSSIDRNLSSHLRGFGFGGCRWNHLSQMTFSSLGKGSLASLYVDDLQVSCEGSDMRMIERQLQTAVNNILKWCDTNGHSISASKSCCVHFCRKRGIHPEIRIRDIQIPAVPDVRFLGVIFDRRLTFLPHILHLRERCEKVFKPLEGVVKHLLGADRTSLLRVYQAIVLSRIDYGCVAYGSACNSTLQKLDPVHHMALRICSGAFRTSPVQSLYVICHQLPLDLRRRKLSLAYYFKILSVPSHPLQNVYMSTSMKRLL
ncbi:putative RNA-directed DNA polymerase from transposon X-element [Trichonephila clavipes]|nr:putative RNA-directed DNA polymerase from transposon X-element [Trichonephila clavipes]